MFSFARKQTDKPVDPDEIVKRYARLLAEGGSFAKPSAALPASKPALKRALFSALERAKSNEAALALTDLYLRLANFQDLSKAEQRRIHDFLLMIGATWAQHENIDDKQKHSLILAFGADAVYGGVIDRIQRETMLLRLELFEAGYMTRADIASKAQSEADGANAFAEKMGLSMRFTASDFQNSEGARHAHS